MEVLHLKTCLKIDTITDRTVESCGIKIPIRKVSEAEDYHAASKRAFKGL